jgi:signal transduction histidine kinase
MDQMPVAPMQNSRWFQNLTQETRQIGVMVGWIGLIHFVVEAAIMVLLSGGQLTRTVIMEGLLDSTLLTVFSGPPIYWWVAKPFIVSARNAEAEMERVIRKQADQARRLEATLTDLQHSLDQNEVLRGRLQHSTEETADVNERTLQKIGADLHDGPAQLLTYSLLRLGKFAPLIEALDGAKGKEEVEYMQVALTDTLTELRNISRGLSLPQLNDATLEQTISMAVTLHQEQTGTKVHVIAEGLPDSVPQALKVCVYRVVQESLANAYKHGQAMSQKVSCSFDGSLILIVSDQGLGFDIQNYNKDGLGLSGMRSRVEALGGALAVDTGPGRGTRVLAAINLENLKQRDVAHV